jgi:hypothetical protein
MNGAGPQTLDCDPLQRPRRSNLPRVPAGIRVSSAVSFMTRPGRCIVLPLICALLVSFVPDTAAAAETAKHGPSLAVFIAQVIVLLTTGRLLGELMQRLGQPAVMGQLIAGILLSPSVLGMLWPGLQHAIFPRAPSRRL